MGGFLVFDVRGQSVQEAAMDDDQPRLKDGDRVSHKEKGLGTISTDPKGDDLVVAPTPAVKPTTDTVYVVWDDERFRVGRIDRGELELLPPAAAAVSSGV
jgi:hypothetical protein